FQPYGRDLCPTREKAQKAPIGKDDETEQDRGKQCGLGEAGLGDFRVNAQQVCYAGEPDVHETEERCQNNKKRYLNSTFGGLRPCEKKPPEHILSPVSLLFARQANPASAISNRLAEQRRVPLLLLPRPARIFRKVCNGHFVRRWLRQQPCRRWRSC